MLFDSLTGLPDLACESFYSLTLGTKQGSQAMQVMVRNIFADCTMIIATKIFYFP